MAKKQQIQNPTKTIGTTTTRKRTRIITRNKRRNSRHRRNRFLRQTKQPILK